MSYQHQSTLLISAIVATALIGLSQLRCDDATDAGVDGDLPDAGVDGGGDGGAEGDGGFGDPCESDEDCAIDVCHEFGQLGWVCTYYCDEDADCPEGSEGQKCNQQGVCRP